MRHSGVSPCSHLPKVFKFSSIFNPAVCDFITLGESNTKSHKHSHEIPSASHILIADRVTLKSHISGHLMNLNSIFMFLLPLPAWMPGSICLKFIVPSSLQIVFSHLECKQTTTINFALILFAITV